MSKKKTINERTNGKQSSGIRDRIKELRRVRAGDLFANPRNWREHPPEQVAAMQGVLTEIGYAGALLAREVDGGKLELIDGHLRKELDPEQIVPVLVLDVSEEEANKLLVTFDPLAALATANADALGKLLAGTETENEALRKMLEGLAAENGIDLFDTSLPPGADGKEYDESVADGVEMCTCPKCGHEFPK